MNKDKENIILLDIDGVVANFDNLIVNFARDSLGIDVNIDREHAEWDMISFPELCNHKDEIWHHLLNTPGLIRSIEPYDGSKKFVNDLREFGRVIACTSAIFPGTFTSERVNWLMQVMEFKRRDIIIGYQKNLVRGDYLIDDKYSNVIDWAIDNEKGTSIHFQTPLRGSACADTYPGNVEYAKDYSYVLDFIKKGLPLKPATAILNSENCSDTVDLRSVYQ